MIMRIKAYTLNANFVTHSDYVQQQLTVSFTYYLHST